MARHEPRMLLQECLDLRFRRISRQEFTVLLAGLFGKLMVWNVGAGQSADRMSRRFRPSYEPHENCVSGDNYFCQPVADLSYSEPRSRYSWSRIAHGSHARCMGWNRPQRMRQRIRVLPGQMSHLLRQTPDPVEYLIQCAGQIKRGDLQTLA